jgi:hypothetical protein
VIAYTTFHAATTEFHDVISNWETPPITAFYFSNSSACASGYSALKTPSWPGTTSDACACASGAYSSKEWAYQSSSSSASCDVNQTDAGCVSQPTLSEVNLDEWHRSTICYKQEGAAQLLSATKERPAASGAGVCASGYAACGNGSTVGDRTTCVQSAQATCPLTSMSATGEGLAAPSGFSAGRTTVDGNATWWFSDATTTSDLMPIAEMKLALYDPSAGGKRGECFQDETKQHKYSGAADSYGYANRYPSECGRVDTRWELLEAQTEAAFLWSNFKDESACSGSSVGETADYLAAAGTRCDGGANTYFTDTSCQVADGTSATSSSFGTAGCGSSDAVCRNVLYQSNCGALRRWASQATEHWAVLVRREIYWQPSCDVSKVDLKAIEAPVDEATPTLLANMIICIIVNVAIGIFFPVCYILNAHYGDVSCIPGEGDVEKKLLDHHKKYLGLFFHVVKLVPALMAMAIFATIASTLAAAAASGCQDASDTRTFQTFETMSDQVYTSNAAVTSQVAMDLVAIVVVAATSLLEHLLAYRARRSADAKNHPDAQGTAVELTPEAKKGGGDAAGGAYRGALRAAELKAFLDKRALGHLFKGLLALGVDSLADYRDDGLVNAGVLKARLGASGEDVAAYESSLDEVAASMLVDGHLVRRALLRAAPRKGLRGT